MYLKVMTTERSQNKPSIFPVCATKCPWPLWFETTKGLFDKTWDKIAEVIL